MWLMRVKFNLIEDGKPKLKEIEIKTHGDRAAEIMLKREYPDTFAGIVSVERIKQVL